MQQEPAELVLLQSRIDELIRERDSLRVSANQGHAEVAASAEVNTLRANADSLEHEHAMLRAEVPRCRANADPSALMSTFNRPRRHSGEGEWVVEPVQPVEAVTRESRYGMRAVRVGDASHPGLPMVAPSFLKGPTQHEQIRGVVIR